MTMQEIKDWISTNSVDNSLFWSEINRIINSTNLASDQRRKLSEFAKNYFIDDCSSNLSRFILHTDTSVKLYALCSDSGIDVHFAEYILLSKLPTNRNYHEIFKENEGQVIMSIKKMHQPVVVEAGLLKLVINALRRDAEEGKVIRGEMADELTTAPVPIDEYNQDQNKEYLSDLKAAYDLGMSVERNKPIGRTIVYELQDRFIEVCQKYSHDKLDNSQLELLLKE